VKLDPKLEKWVFPAIDLQGKEVWVGPFNSKKEANRYRDRYVGAFSRSWAFQRKSLCGGAIHPTKKFRIPKMLEGYVFADYRGRLWSINPHHHNLPEFATKDKKPLKPKMRVVHEDRGKKHVGRFFDVGTSREGALEKAGCYRPEAVTAIDEKFLSVVDKRVDPACRIFKVKFKRSDVRSASIFGGTCSLEVDAFTVVEEVDKKTHLEYYKKHKKFYDARQKLEDTSLRVDAATKKVASSYLSRPDGNKIRAMLLIAAEGRIVKGAYRPRDESRVSKSVAELSKDELFMEKVTKLYRFMHDRGGVGVMRAMVEVSIRFREDLIERELG